MRELLVSINLNNLKISYCGPEGCGGISSEISPEIVKGSQILDKERLTEDLISLSNEILPKGKKPDGLNFLIGPEDFYVFFVTVNKNDGDLDEQIVSSIKDKLEVPLEDLYFSYTKIAPFVYQFIGVSQKYLDDLLDISNLWGMPTNAIIPWVSLLPKTLKDTDPAIFVASVDDKYVVSLSELNGVYFAQSYDEPKNPKELEKLVKTLSVYNRKKPIKRIFTLNSSLKLKNGYDVLPVLDENETHLAEGFEIHELYLHILQENREILSSKINLLNSLPLPVLKSKSNVLVPAVASVFLVGLLIGGYFLFFNKPQDSDEVVAGVSSEAIDSVVESTASEETTTDSSQGAKELDKEQLVIRIENAAGITGAAGRTQDLLEEGGYSIASIDTADNMREITQILIKDNFSDYKDVLLEDLGDYFPEALIDSLEESDVEYNVLILIGKDSEI